MKSVELSVEDVEVSVIPNALMTGDFAKSPSVKVVENVPVAMLVLAVGAVIEDKGTVALGAGLLLREGRCAKADGKASKNRSE